MLVQLECHPTGLDISRQLPPPNTNTYTHTQNCQGTSEWSLNLPPPLHTLQHTPTPTHSESKSRGFKQSKNIIIQLTVDYKWAANCLWSIHMIADGSCDWLSGKTAKSIKLAIDWVTCGETDGTERKCIPGKLRQQLGFSKSRWGGHTHTLSLTGRFLNLQLAIVQSLPGSFSSTQRPFGSA